MLASTIGLIGAGRMATALARGFVDAKLVIPAQIVASDPSDEARAAFERAVSGARIVAENRAVVESADVNFVESTRFLERISRTAENNGPGMGRLANRLDKVDESVRDQFVQLSLNVYACHQERLAKRLESEGQFTSNASKSR